MQVVDRRLTMEPNDANLHFWKACLNACLIEAEPHHWEQCGRLHFDLARYHCLLGAPRA